MTSLLVLDVSAARVLIRLHHARAVHYMHAQCHGHHVQVGVDVAHCLAIRAVHAHSDDLLLELCSCINERV